MDRATTEPAIKLLLTEIHSRLNEAVRIVKAVEACAEAALPKARSARWRSNN